MVKLILALMTAVTMGRATYYAHDFHGLPMANGKPYNMYANTAASNKYPLGTRLKVTSRGGRSVDVVVTDRGAFTHALDLSYGAFGQLGNHSEGVLQVVIINGEAEEFLHRRTTVE